ncbi:Phosphatidylserine decarboxylase proenzyme isoform 1 [Schistosoma japonicum]|uniref:phosphatidylserine decarboxylase n=1 Tax=Schistosoma japonicum TaxID=6182 RepID=A0A4Z2DHA9_SCHJA|nr:Phosphatidylserine decarboxylase proenzyme isoform 1 [Schistosoma japonicum]
MYRFNLPKRLGKLIFRTNNSVLSNGSRKGLKFKLMLGTCGILCGYVGFLLFADSDDTPQYYPGHLTATLFRRVPLNGLSKFWGQLAECHIPVPLRPIVYYSYSRFFHCDLNEVEDPNLKSYPCLSDFFIRKISPDKRPICYSASVVSPVDGEVLHCGPIDQRKAVLEQIKGIRYSLDEFLGPIGSKRSFTRNKSDRTLYQCVVYLAPGDCHRFHSPVEWVPTVRRHFPGRLLSVRPNIAGRLPGLYTINERVVYLGEWDYGLMSFTAVGAFGVGNIHVNIDPKLITNKTDDNPIRFRSSNTSMMINNEYSPPYLEEVLDNRIKVKKGDEFGYFRLGSTIVLIFEAPSNSLKWCIKPGQRIKLGEPIIVDC